MTARCQKPTQRIINVHDKPVKLPSQAQIVKCILGRPDYVRPDESLRDLKTAIAFSNREVESFAHLFGENRTLFGKSMALLEGERGPWSIVMNENEVNKLKKWIEN